jgi:AraC family transcriptional regulator
LVLMRLAALRGAAPPKARTGRLSRKALARVEDYIEARLGTDIALADLAELADLPIDAFARRFKAATGLAPYAFVIERRVRRAEALLRSTGMEIGTIALALGFSSQSHLTTTFRRATGTTPGAYRAHFSPES